MELILLPNRFFDKCKINRVVKDFFNNAVESYLVTDFKVVMPLLQQTVMVQILLLLVSAKNHKRA